MTCNHVVGPYRRPRRIHVNAEVNVEVGLAGYMIMSMTKWTGKKWPHPHPVKCKFTGPGFYLLFNAKPKRFQGWPILALKLIGPTFIHCCHYWHWCVILLTYLFSEDHWSTSLLKNIVYSEGIFTFSSMEAIRGEPSDNWYFANGPVPPPPLVVWPSK
jgi:hypothetical protein